MRTSLVGPKPIFVLLLIATSAAQHVWRLARLGHTLYLFQWLSFSLVRSLFKSQHILVLLQPQPGASRQLPSASFIQIRATRHLVTEGSLSKDAGLIQTPWYSLIARVWSTSLHW
ncbi:hypothetical protein B0T12DRAFT_406653 [Alternaria alternata]|nr:hypothetical protein B0T12DRAFT_406653 [Alternaria alternata]